VRCSIFHLATLTIKGSDLLLDHESCKMEYKHPILKKEHLAKLKASQLSMEPLNRRHRSAIIKVKLLFNGNTSQKDGEGAPRKTCTSILVRCFILHNLATSKDRGMQICVSILKGSKVMESKTPNLEGLLQTPCEVLYLHLAPLTARRTEP
jgi:hypothetical protein